MREKTEALRLKNEQQKLNREKNILMGKRSGKDIVIDCELVKINDNKSHSFYTVSIEEDF